MRCLVTGGTGSASFEMLRYLTERLPTMVTPRWVHSRIQPIAIRDVLHYLVGAATLPAGVSRAFDIGGPDVLTYWDMMARYAVAWRLRGLLDQVAGGAAGLRRGRRDPARLRVGDTVDSWRVEALEPERLLRLRSEMRLPGRAWLEMTVRPGDDGGTVYAQRAIFHPYGLLGHLYWWAISPFHRLIFGGMPRNIVKQADEAAWPTTRHAARR
jgi:hypothetical protein